MGGGSKRIGPLGSARHSTDSRGPLGLSAGSNAAQALPPAVAEYADTTEKEVLSWLGGRAQILLCRIAAPRPDFTWTLERIRQETKRDNQLGFTDCAFASELVPNPKAEEAGYFSARAALRTIVIRIPKELNVSDAQVQAAELKKDEPLRRRLAALQACRDLLVEHELKHIEKAWGSLGEVSLGWYKRLGQLREGTTVTAELLERALDDGDSVAPSLIENSAIKWDDDDLGLLTGRFGGLHVFVSKGEKGTFDYIERRESGG